MRFRGRKGFLLHRSNTLFNHPGSALLFYSMQSFSQNDEQQRILNHFYNFTGRFLDLGSNDGITLSNTHALALLGWSGVCVEASPAAYKRLRTTYNANTKIQTIGYAVGSHDGEIILHESGELLGTGDIALVSSTKDEELKRWESLKMKFTPVIVPCVTFKTLMKEIGGGKFDLLSIDIEGMEKEVVPQIDFNELGTKMAVIEWNGKDADLFDGIMRNFNFNLVHVNAENRLYAR